MSRPRFLADEDLRFSIVQAVRRWQPAVEITTVLEKRLVSASDEEVLQFAWRDRWLLVSHDVTTMRAFAAQRIVDNRGIHGLFIAPQSRTAREIAECLILIWSASEFDEWRDRIVYVPF